MYRRVSVILVSTLVVSVATGPVSSAEPVPSDTDIEHARQTERAVEDAVAAAERRLAAVAARTDQLAEAAARAAEAYNGARYALAEADAAERKAAGHARRAAGAAGEARAMFGRVAAATYRAGGQFANLGLVLRADDTDHFLDGATALHSVTRSQGMAYQRAADATAAAEWAAAEAEQALADRQAAAQAAEQASAEAADQVMAQEELLVAAERERAALVAELAEARGTTQAMEEERQAGLEAAAAAEREREAREQAARERGENDSGAPDPTPPDVGSGDDAGPPDLPASGTAGPASPQSRPSTPTAEPEPVITSPPPTRPATATGTPVPATNPPAPRRTSTHPPPQPAPSPTTTRAPAPPAVNVSAAQRAITYARAQVGKPYQWGASGPDAFDCSGLTMRAWQHAGTRLPHWSVAQARALSRVAYADLRPGDLIFWSDNGQASGTYHVALYIGGGQMVHAPRPGRNVEIQSVFYWRTPSFYGRV